MEILHIGDRSGVAFNLATLSRHNGYEARVIFRPAHDKLGIWKNYQSFAEPHFERTSKFLFNVLIIAKNFDIIHSHIDIIIPFLRILYPRKQIICHYHGSDLRHRSTIRTKFISFFTKKIAISTPDLLGYVPKSKTTFIPNVISDDFFTTKLDERERTIFLPITLRKDKNYMFNLQSWKIIRDLIPDIKLKIIKLGQGIKECQEFLLDDNRVIWLEPLQKNQMIKEMHSCSIVWEQHLLGVFGLTAMEAMASGVPVFTYFDDKNNLNGNYNPPVFSIKTPKEQAELTVELLNNEKLRIEKGYISQKWIIQNHSIKAVWDILRKLYAL